MNIQSAFLRRWSKLYKYLDYSLASSHCVSTSFPTIATASISTLAPCNIDRERKKID